MHGHYLMTLSFLNHYVPFGVRMTAISNFKALLL